MQSYLHQQGLLLKLLKSNFIQMNTLAGYKTLLIQRTFWLFTGRAMPVIVLFLITILYSRRLTYDEYGTFQSVWMYANIINVIISFGFSSIILSTNIPFLFLFIKNNRKLLTRFYMALWITGLVIFFLFSKNFRL